MALGWLAFAAASMAAPSPVPGAEAAARLLVTEVGSSGPTLGTLNLTRVTDPECCALVGWAADSQAVLVLTRPASAQVMQVQAIPVAGGKAELAWKRPASFSPDGSLAVEQETDSVRITRRSSGASWAIANAGRELRFSPDGTRIAWDIVSSGITHPDVREHSVWVAEVSGASPRKLATTIGGGLVGWTAGGQALIVTGRIQANGQEGIWSIGLDASEPRLIHRAYRPRDPLISPGGEWIAFHIAFTGDAGQNGLWIVRTDGSALSKITPFGAYRWRTDDRLLLIPLTAQEAPTLFEIDASAGRALQLTDPRLTSLPIANGEWIVSPDGSRLAFTSWADRAVWVLQLPD
jgi:dipeptidyl aminopeptidase/acylaminoacyl peptidase